MKRLHFTVLVIGAGPAGLAAATSAAQSTASVGLIDDNPLPGGQIWRGGPQSTPNAQATAWLERASGITTFNCARVIATSGPGALLVETPEQTLEVHCERLILATGARELFLPFPGWTLPGVMGAGGLQALVKGGLPVKGKRVVVAGSGPLLLAVAVYLRAKGAQVRLIAEQTSWTKLSSFVLNLARHPGHLGQASNLGRDLLRVPFRANCWVNHAHGTERLEAVTLSQSGKTVTVAGDYLACGFGLVPNIELPTALGCAIIDGAVAVDQLQRTSVENLYCAGEVTGVGGLDLSLVEGQIAGFAATGQLDEARKLFLVRQRARHFAALLRDSFALRAELKTLAEDDTLVCRCEDVRYRDVQQHRDWRSAKIHTRCGMGPCQGRVCGAATAFLFGWTPSSVRPPITVARLASFASIQEEITS
jgi:NADPH-dependent 2,4-dienoyl-CoA reductase/sulfur reductase-like enzyme